MLPHANPGTMARREIAALQPFNPSMGLMLESTSKALYAPGGPHEFAPSKRPRVRCTGFLCVLKPGAPVVFRNNLGLPVGSTLRGHGIPGPDVSGILCDLLALAVRRAIRRDSGHDTTAHSDDRDRLFRSIPTTYSDASRPLLWPRVRGCLILATE